MPTRSISWDANGFFRLMKVRWTTRRMLSAVAGVVVVGALAIAIWVIETPLGCEGIDFCDSPSTDRFSVPRLVVVSGGLLVGLVLLAIASFYDD